MKSTFFFLIILVILLAACKGKAVKYNDKIVDIETSLSPEVSKAEKKIGNYFEKQDWDNLAKEAKRMEKVISDKLSDIKDDDAPDVEGAAGFKKASIKYLTFWKNIYTSYRKIGEAETDGERQTEEANFQTLIQQKDDELQQFKSVQKDFATANNFKIAKDDSNTEDDQPKKKKKTTDE